MAGLRRSIQKLRLKFSATKIDASSVDNVVSVIKEHGITHLMNAVEPKFVPPLFEAAEKAGINYLDMAMSLSLPHPENPYELHGSKTRR